MEDDPAVWARRVLGFGGPPLRLEPWQRRAVALMMAGNVKAALSMCPTRGASLVRYVTASPFNPRRLLGWRIDIANSWRHRPFAPLSSKLERATDGR